MFVAAFNLIEWEEIFHVFQHRKLVEIFYFALCTFISLVFDVETCVLLSVLVSGIAILRRSTKIEAMLLGRSEVKPSAKTDSESFPTLFKKVRYTDAKTDPSVKLDPKIIIISIKSRLMFYNIGNLRDKIEKLRKNHRKLLVTSPKISAKFIILDLTNSSNADSAAFHLLKMIIESYKNEGIGMKFCGLNPVHKTGFKENHIFDVIEKSSDIFKSVHDAESACLQEMETLRGIKEEK